MFSVCLRREWESQERTLTAMASTVASDPIVTPSLYHLPEPLSLRVSLQLVPVTTSADFCTQVCANHWSLPNKSPQNGLKYMEIKKMTGKDFKNNCFKDVQGALTCLAQ